MKSKTIKQNITFKHNTKTKKQIKHNNSSRIKNMEHDNKSKQPISQYNINLILLPNQCFPIEDIVKEIHTNLNLDKQKHSIPVNITLTMLEHPVFFGDRIRITNMNFNKKKLVYHRATCKLYMDSLELNKSYYDNIKIIKKEYINYTTIKNKKQPLGTYIKKLTTTNSANTYTFYFDPVDHQLYEELKQFNTANHTKQQNTTFNIKCLDSLLFISPRNKLEEFHTTKNKKKSFFHATFYSWQKQQVDILANTKSYDTQNRNKMPKNESVPDLPRNDSTKYKTYIIEAIKYIAKIKGKDYKYGIVNNEKDIIFPLTRDTSLEWLQHFCKHRLHKFGKYQDAIDSNAKNFLYHSCISPMLNIGLITPRDVINIVKEYYESNKSSVGIANYEGFMRQVLGWREYQRYCYLYAYNDMINSNYFDNNKNLDTRWYHNSNTNNINNSNNVNNNSNKQFNIKPLDDAIKMAWQDAYLHHILRLMVVGNFMNLYGIHPDEAYKWFMEFSLDSYDWVMIQNIYGMAMWSDGGLTMHKPYISGDGYIMKMSTYTKEKDMISKETGKLEKAGWNSKWYALYYNFINKNRNKLKNTYYAGMIKNYDKKSKEEKDQIDQIVKSI